MSGRNKVDIEVMLTKVPISPAWPDGIRYDLITKLKQGNKLVFNNDGLPGFDIKFKISDPDNTGYLFPADEKEAMWVTAVSNENDPCPQSPMYWSGFEATNVTGSRKTLEVTNTNACAQLFKFALRFTLTPENNGPCISYDPIGDNRNGPSYRAPLSKLVGVGLAVAAAAALFGFLAGRASL